MKRESIYIISIILFILSSIIYDNFYTASMISGTYIYDFPAAIAEGPNRGDRLILTENGSFESDAWGNGTFELTGSKLELSYTYQFGGAGFECSIYRPLFWGKPRISIEKDLEYYFEKVD